MRIRPLDRPRRRGPGAALLAAALVLAACSDDADDPATGEADPAGDAAGADADGDADAAGADADGDDGEGSAAPAEELVAEDGFNGPLEAEGPGEPGAAVLRIEGREIDLEVSCEAPGIVGEHGHLLFHFAVVSEGEADDGRRVMVNATRQVVDLEEAAASVYAYTGQERASFQVTVEAEEGWHSSVVVSPADDDPDGDHLPVVRVEQDGTFSAVHDLEALAAVHDTALEGPAEFAGTCQDGWDEAATG